MFILKNISGNNYIKVEGKSVFFDSVLLEDLLKEFKTPILLFLENRIRHNIDTFTEALKTTFQKFKCFYSYKANYLQKICEIVHSKDIGAELISNLELNLALKLNLPGKEIILGGPLLSKEIIRSALLSGVCNIAIYNLEDLKVLDALSKQLKKPVNVFLRVSNEKYTSHLGVNLNKANLSELKKVNESDNFLNIDSILSHYGTQMNSAFQFDKNTQLIVNNIKLLDKIGIKIQNLNFGGGFPEAAVMDKNNLVKIFTTINKTLTSYNLKYENIMFEPGRYFVGDAGVFVSKVVNLSQNRTLFLNVGNHICPKFSKSSFRFYNASKIDQPHKYKTTIAGIIPTDQDILAKNYFFTQITDKDDIVIITNSGAYTLTFSNRFPYALPKIILIKEDSYRVIFNPDEDLDFSLSKNM